jgi:hypothetical protein
MRLKLDSWQQEVLDTDGDICLRSGRQVGKSTIISIKAAEHAVKHPKKTILVIASVERQAFLLFEKILAYLSDNYRNYIKAGKDKPTKHRINLKNGSVIMCYPTGLSGYGIRGFTVDLLIVDEAAFVPDDVFTAVTPMLSVTKGHIVLLSTPHGKGGYFYDCFQDPHFRSFHLSSEECERVNKDWLRRERERMSKVQYAQEYLGEFVDDLRQVFPDELIKKCMVLKRRGEIRKGRDYYLGVDIARMGEDESTFEILDRTDRKHLVQVENQVTTKTLTTETTKTILGLNELYNFRQIFVDDGGMGVGVFDQLLTNPKTSRKVRAIYSEARPLTRDEKKRRKIIKEEIYNNMVMLMERGEIKLLDDPEIFLSLKSVQFEIDEITGKAKYFGNYTHIATGLVFAAWCSQTKNLNISIHYV